MAKKKPAPAVRKADTVPPPHPLAGYYRDNTDKLYWVPSRPEFKLFRLNDDWQPVDPDSPVKDDEEEFRRQLRHSTFTRINH